MKGGRQAVLMAALMALSSCSAPAAITTVSEIERLRDYFTRRVLPREDGLPPPVEPVEIFPPDEEGGS